MADLMRLHTTLVAAAPSVRGVAVGKYGDPSTVRIDFDPAATSAQRAAAQAALNSFDWSDAAQAAWEADRMPERKTLRAAAAQAVADIDAYLALAVPTPVQTAAQVRRLSQMMRAVIQRLAQID